jgi:hypothetical protein
VKSKLQTEAPKIHKRNDQSLASISSKTNIEFPLISTVVPDASNVLQFQEVGADNSGVKNHPNSIEIQKVLKQKSRNQIHHLALTDQ